MLEFLKSLIDADKLGGWVRALVASGLGLIAAKYAVLGTFLTPTVREAVAVLAVTAVVGIWSQIAKAVAPPA